MASESDAIYDELSRLNNELVNLQRELSKKNATLERLNQLKNQFLGMVSHDLRKPAGAVMAYSEFLLEEAADTLDPEHLGFVRVINEAGLRMRRLIDAFLDVALIEADRFDLDREPTDLRRLLDAAVELIGPAAERRSISIVLDVPRDLPPLSLDASKFEQVVLNLISNSVEHTPEGTEVRVRARARERRAELEVADNGPGIAPEQMSTLFELGKRRRGTKASGEQSSGLGLVIVKLIVEAHGGTVAVQSALGEGTSFTVRLPETLAV